MTGNVVRLPEDHYIALLAVELATQDGTVTGHAPVRSELFAPGTRRIRTGPLATMVDLVAGHTPDGPFGPTVDLRMQVFAPPPTTGRMSLHCRALRVGARLIVAETVLRAEGSETPFGRAVTTFMNLRVGPGLPPGPRPLPPMTEPSFDAFLGARVHDARSLAVDPVPRIANGIQGTVQGGAQALLAELAAEHALGGGGRLVATDLDIRFLSRLRAGPLVATVDELPAADGTIRAGVSLLDAGGADKLVSYVLLTLERA